MTRYLRLSGVRGRLLALLLCLSVALAHVPAPPLGAVPLALGAATAPNLLQNPGFELDADGNGKPDGWGAHPAVSRSSAVRYGGSYSMRHHSSANASYVASQVVQGIVAGQRYSVSGWTNIPATADAFTYKLEVLWRNANNLTLRIDVIKAYTAATNGWVWAGGTRAAPAGTTNAVIRMNVGGLAATIYADALVLKRADPPVTATRSATSVASPTATAVVPTLTATSAPTETPPTATSAPSTHAITGTVAERVLYREMRYATLDIMIVFDASASMRFGWTCHAFPPCPNDSLPGDRMTAARAAVKSFIDEVFTAPGADPPDAQIGLLAFGLSGNTAAMRHPFTDYTGQSSLKAAVDGIVATANTPTATGLKLAVDQLQARPETRVVTTTNGLGEPVLALRRVHKVILLVTDGMANVRLGLAQLNDDGRIFNGIGRGDDVAFQKTTVVTNPTAPIPRPIVVDPPNSPIMQAVAQANAAKAAKMEVFVVGMAFFSNSMDYMEFDEMASSSLDSHMFDARSPADLSAFLSVAHAAMLRKRCIAQPLPDRPAAGAEVSLYDAASAELVATTSVGADGSYRFAGLAAGRSYHIVTAHRGVVGPDGVARDYSWMEPGASSPLLIGIDPNGPESQRVADVLLTIERRGDPPAPVSVCP